MQESKMADQTTTQQNAQKPKVSGNVKKPEGVFNTSEIQGISSCIQKDVESKSIEQKQTPSNIQKNIKPAENKVFRGTENKQNQQVLSVSKNPKRIFAHSENFPVKEQSQPSQQPKPETKPQVEKTIRPQPSQPLFKVFNTWSPEGVIVKNIALKDYISIRPLLVPKTGGKFADSRFWKAKYHIIERLANHIQVAGHKRKKHHKSSGKNTGKIVTVYNIVKQAFQEIEKKTKQNPLQVLVDAIENACPRQGIITIEYGGVRYPKAVDLSPLKRVDLGVRWLAQQAFHSSSTSKKPHKRMYQVLADELLLASKADQNSAIIKKKIELEKQAAASK